MERFKLLLAFLLLMPLLHIGCSLTYDEGRAFLKLKHLVNIDPSGHSSDWVVGVEKHANPCGLSGDACEENKAVPLTTVTGTTRKLLKASSPPDTSIAEKKGVQKSDSPPPPPRSPSPSLPSLSPPPRVPSPHSSKPSHPRSTHSPPVNSASAKHKNKNVLYPAIGIGTCLFAIVILVLIYHRCNKVVLVKPWATGLSGQLQKAFVTGVPVLKRQEIEAACEDFSNIIGSLRDGILYKGTLSSGVEIAVTSAIVKSSKDWSKHAEAQFKQKVAMLSKVNHKNFVNLLGYCTQEDPFARMMVFEYAPNGTLYDHLHSKEVEALNWGARLRIAMGIAYCLDHMNQLNPPVILQSLDSTSILLTDDYAAKIADLEFWNQTVSSDTDSGHLNTTMSQSGVVYKYGLILFEIISGRLLNSEVYREFTEWSAGFSSGKETLKGIVDTDLKPSYNEEDLHKIADVIKSCLNPDPNGRPSMKEIAGRMREITSVHPDGATPKLSPLWWAELEIISTEGN